MTFSPTLTRELLSQMKDLVVRSSREKVEYSAVVGMRSLQSVSKGTEYHPAGIVSPGRRAFHTHAFRKPDASTADILEIVQQGRPSSSVGSFHPFLNRVVITEYSLPEESRAILSEVVREIEGWSSEVKLKWKEKNIKVAVNVDAYVLVCRWQVESKVVVFTVGYTISSTAL